MQFITSQTELEQCCSDLLQQPVIALDTEFVRERTFYPALGLVQIADRDNVYLIDPLALEDLSPLKQLVESPDVIKVIHSCGEDIEVLNIGLRATPTAFFDTQIAHAFISDNASIGLGAMVAQYQGVELDKGHARTNWLKRPLSPQQLDYAADDVRYLLPIFDMQMQKLVDINMLDYVEQEVTGLISKRTQEVDPQLAWRDVKSAWELSPRELAVLAKLIEWRFNYAVEKNLALNFVVHERSIITLCQRRPSSFKSMFNIPGIHPMEIKRHGKAMLACIEAGKAVPEEECPVKIKRVAEISGYKKIYSKLKNLAADVAEGQNISVELLAPKRLINQFIGYHWQVTEWSRDVEPDVTLGWRGALLAEAFKAAIAE